MSDLRSEGQVESEDRTTGTFRTRISRRGLITGAVTAAGVTVGGAALLAGTGNVAFGVPDEKRATPGGSGVTLCWLGNNAWKISFGTTTILVDPWVTRFPTGTYTTSGTRPDTPLVTSTSTVDTHIDKANLILCCEGHFDHMADAPYVARRTGAAVLGTESHVNMLRAMDTPEAQLGIVKGGEYLRFRGFTVRVIPSLHSLMGNQDTFFRPMPFPGTRLGAVPPRPKTVADLVEGGTLAYQITIEDRLRVFVMSTANFIERELAGLKPDVAIVAVGGNSLYDYAGRLMRALDQPTWVLPTHWDDIDLPLSEPARDFGGVQPLREAVKAASPKSEFVVLDHLRTFTP